MLTHLVFALIDDCGIAQLIKTDPIKIRLLVGCHTWTLPGPGVSSPSESSPSSVLARTRCLGGFKKWWIKNCAQAWIDRRTFVALAYTFAGLRSLLSSAKF